MHVPAPIADGLFVLGLVLFVAGGVGVLTGAVPEVAVVGLGALALVFVGAGTSMAPDRDRPLDPLTRTH